MSNTVKSGDTVAITLTVRDGANQPVNLTGCTNLRVIANLTTATTPGVDLLPVTPTDAPNGKVQHQLTGTLPPGTYNIEFEYTDTAGVKITAPTVGYGKLVVERDLDTAV